jgi:hypothetical protein
MLGAVFGAGVLTLLSPSGCRRTRGKRPLRPSRDCASDRYAGTGPARIGARVASKAGRWCAVQQVVLRWHLAMPRESRAEFAAIAMTWFA